MTNIGRKRMMRDNKLPSCVEKQIRKQGIEKQDILAVSPFDLSFSSEYVNGYVFLTKDILGVAVSEPDPQSIRYFRGTRTKDMAYGEDQKEYACRLYERNKITNIFIYRQLATSLVIMQYKGIEYRLCALTNLYLAQMNDFVKVFFQGVKPEEKEEKEEDSEELYCPRCGTMYPDPVRKICPKCMNKRSIFTRALGYFWKYRAKMTALFLCYIFSAFINLLWPYLSGTVLFDWVLNKNDAILGKIGIAGEYTLALLILVAAMIVARILQRGVTLVQGVLMAQVVADTVRDMKQDVFAALGRLSIGFFTSKQTGSLMTRVLSDAERVTNFFLDGFPYIFIHGFTIIASFCVMFRLSAPMALVACVLLPLLVFMSVRLKPKLWSLFGRRHRAEHRVLGRMQRQSARVVAPGCRDAGERGDFTPGRYPLRRTSHFLSRPVV